jgi:hypothetical protein
VLKVLSVSYGVGATGGTDASEGADVTTMKASFAFGPVTAAMSINDYGQVLTYFCCRAKFLQSILLSN